MFCPRFGGATGAGRQGALSVDPLVRGLNEEALVLLLAEVVRLSGVRLPAGASAGSKLVAQAQELLAAQLHQGVALEALGDELGLSKFHVLRTFQKETGLSPRQWAMQLRTRRAQGLLRSGLGAAEVAHDLGFADQSHLNRHFRAAYGITPGRYQSAILSKTAHLPRPQTDL